MSFLTLSGALLLSAIAPGCDDSETCDDSSKCAADTVADTDTLAPDTEAPADTVPPIDTVETTETGDGVADAPEPEDTTAPLDTAPEVAAPAGTEVMSDKSAYRVWFDGPTSIKVGVEASFSVTVHDLSDLPVAGLDLAPRFIHTVMGHGGPRDPSASDIGGGAYEVTDVIASMSGKWDLDVLLPGADRATLTITVGN